MYIALARTLFALLTLFEGLNYVRVLHFSLVYTWFGLIVTVLGIWALMELTNRKKSHHPVSWFLALTVVSADAGGDMLHFYEHIPHFDKYVHFSISAVGVIIVLLLIHRHAAQLHARDYLLAASAVIALGALYEMEEFWESVLLKSNRWGGGSDTLTDLTANVAGALLATAVGWCVARSMKQKVPR
jgi:uncharacterized membrane protein YjdF